MSAPPRSSSLFLYELGELDVFKVFQRVDILHLYELGELDEFTDDNNSSIQIRRIRLIRRELL